MPASEPVPPTVYVALGDSFSEGLCDPDGVPADAAAGPGYPGPWRGWADRLAEIAHESSLAAGGPGVVYANLAVRGRLLPQVLADQLPVALDVGADLVSLIGGGNDVLRPGADPDVLAESLEHAVVRLRRSGAQVLLGTGVDPKGSPLIRMTRGKVATYNAHIWSIAARRGAHVLDLWGMPVLKDWRVWATDRLHLNAEGHELVAQLAARSLGILPAGLGDHATADVPDEVDVPRAGVVARPRAQALREDAVWVRGYVAPWVRRRLRGQSSGDGRPAKRPHPLPLDARD